MRALDLSKQAKKFLERLVPKHYEQIIKQIYKLLQNPRPQDSETLKGYDSYYRIDIGEYRTVYSFSAFQYALLSSLVMSGRVYIGPLAGYIADNYGWGIYFISSFVLSVPGLILLRMLKGNLDKIKESAKSPATEAVGQAV